MSVSRHCAIYLAVDNQWYMDLAHEEYGESDDASTYGPFKSEEDVMKYLDDNFSNPGGYSIDNSGKEPVPTVSPNGENITRPIIRRGWGY